MLNALTSIFGNDNKNGTMSVHPYSTAIYKAVLLKNN